MFQWNKFLPKLKLKINFCLFHRCIKFHALHFFIAGLPPAEVVSMHFQLSDSIVSSPAKPFLIGRSRLETDLEELEVLGSGRFDDVIKVGGAN